jgi:hypothetical protein
MRSASSSPWPPLWKTKRCGLAGDDPVSDAVLEAGHHGQHHDERGHAEKDATETDPDEQREVRPLTARSEVPEAEEAARRAARASRACLVLAGRAASSGASREQDDLANRGLVRDIMSRRSIPIPSPAAGGMPYSSART